MEHTFFHRLNSILWGVLVSLVVLLAIYVSVGRMLTSIMAGYQDDILRELNHRVPFIIDAEGVGAEWRAFAPVVVLKGLRLTAYGSSERSIDLSEGRIGLDVAGSLRTGTLQMNHLSLDGLKLKGDLTDEGKVQIRGFHGADTQLGDWLEDFLLIIEHITLDGVDLELTLPGGEQRYFDLDLQLSRDGSYRHLDLTLLSNNGMQIRALAEGIGNPFKPELFTGEFYLNIYAADLGAVKDLLAGAAPVVWLEGALEVQLWSNWDEGEPSAEIRFDSRDLLVATTDQRWQVPLQRLAFEASLLERNKHWKMFISDLEVVKEDVSLKIPRVQLDARDETLSVRTTDIQLAPLSTIWAGIESAPLAGLLQALQLRGAATALQLSVTDINEPLQDWRFFANFEQVAVDSWKGAPGVSAASGYVELAPGGGFVALDSRQLTLDFPKMYRQPLHYDDLHGTINIDWDKEAVEFSSGLVAARGAEGEAHILLGLNIPLVESEVGMELDLLVGLSNAHPNHRAKYVPYLLNESLREWLSSSIGEGMVEQGGFVWRGSLLPGAAPLRTVQMFFNIEDTALRYHPGWPAVTDLTGILLIDDSNASVWAESARLFESQIDHLSVETWKNEAEHIVLALDASMHGPAADGLAVINGSELKRFAGSAFTDWQLVGQLATELNLEMNLTDKSAAPNVQVSTRWQDVDLDIRPGDIPVRALNGELNYSTKKGFSAQKLVGELWGEELTASVRQLSPMAQAGAAAAHSAVSVEIATAVDMIDVRQWLNLDSLAFAQGRSAVNVRVLVPPDELPSLTMDTSLAGISLDLPSPWGKSSAPDHRQLHLSLPLGGDGMLLGVELEGGLKLQLDILDRTIRAGALAFNDAPAALEADTLRITGQTMLVNVDEWTRFVNEYFIDQQLVEPAPESASEADPEPAGQDWPLKIVIDKLQTDHLVTGGIDLGDLVFDLVIDDGPWRIAAQTDWLRGTMELTADGSPSRLDISHLDLSGLSEVQRSREDEQEPLALPDMLVTISDLSRAGRSLGQLAFGLHCEDTALYAEEITGEIAGMQLRKEEPGHLRWLQGPDSQTELDAGLYFKNLGKTLAKLGYQKIVETKRGKFELALNWPGSPQDFSLPDASGSVQVDIDEGRFLDTPSGASGTLAVVNILNLAEIVRRLSLSHMYESGIPFDQVDGEVFFHAGTIEVPRMDVQGGSTSFQFSGVSEVATRTLDGELAVTLPLANNLPWLVALTSGLPVAAGVFVLSQVFKKQVNRLTSAVYRTKGTWDDPEVTFDRVFDDSSQLTRGAVVQGQAPGVMPQSQPPATADQP